MPSQSAETLIDKWINDTAFRNAMRRDPDAAVKAAGVTLSDDERAALKAIDWSQSDQQLAERTSKYGS
jgi:hypothetical protein